MALCIDCGSTVTGIAVCPKCGSNNVKEIDKSVFGTSNIPDRRTVDGDWDAAAAELMKKPTKESLREVKREGRKRRFFRRRFT